jgi:hypothetical protein
VFYSCGQNLTKRLNSIGGVDFLELYGRFVPAIREIHKIINLGQAIGLKTLQQVELLLL